jgi:hypothetical protein
MHDIALGMQELGLQAFANKVNALSMSEWTKHGLFDEDEDSWGRAFEQALTRTLACGGRFHFDLSGLNIAEALAGDPEIWVGRYTAWELQQIIRNSTWFSNTLFYLNGKQLLARELDSIGIPPQNRQP